MHRIRSNTAGPGQNVCDHLRGGWVIAARDALDVDAVLRDGFSDAMKSQINVRTSSSRHATVTERGTSLRLHRSDRLLP